jgi:hypothetical protein
LRAAERVYRKGAEVAKGLKAGTMKGGFGVLVSKDRSYPCRSLKFVVEARFEEF